MFYINDNLIFFLFLLRLYLNDLILFYFIIGDKKNINCLKFKDKFKVIIYINLKIFFILIICFLLKFLLKLFIFRRNVLEVNDFFFFIIKKYK